MRSARELGFRCVAVYTDADRSAVHVQEADESILLSGGYLDIAGVLDAAARTGATAIHPGYGFLSENPTFARAVGEAGITWVGPPAAAIAGMGDKLEAKRAAVAAGVPVLPSADEPSGADRVGYPLLVKASAGGGGKGMRIVDDPTDLDDAVASARREAAGAFGDDTVFLERYLARARHIEIQILGDQHGGLVHLGERECSIQRRHQKIIEESPSPVIDGATRSAMGDAALRLASAIGYQSAGTVEFIVDDESGDFYFLEANTRLQVEHPVTEAVTGIDLVRAQLLIAMGEHLEVDQEQITWTGHAIEARLYAEDPAAGFLPAVGTVVAYAPRNGAGIRWDSGITLGTRVTTDFDPMLAKVIAHAPTRTEAARRLAAELEASHVGGLRSNLTFLVNVLRDPSFLAGATTTDFIDRIQPARQRVLEEEERQRVAAAAALWLQAANRADAEIWSSLPSGWRNSKMPPERVEFAFSDDSTVVVEYRRRRDGAFDLGEGRSAHIHRCDGGCIDIDIDGRRARWSIGRSGSELSIHGPIGTVALRVVARFADPHDTTVVGGCKAPMPGKVIEVRAAPGDRVAAGATLVILEAMKMEHHITAPSDGIVEEVLVIANTQVETGAVLLVFVADEAEGASG